MYLYIYICMYVYVKIYEFGCLKEKGQLDFVCSMGAGRIAGMYVCVYIYLHICICENIQMCSSTLCAR